MGFQNRYITKELISYYLNSNKQLKDLFDNETLVFEDKVSSLTYELFSNGISDEEIKNKIINLKNNMEE